LQGVSLLPILKDPTMIGGAAPPRTAAISQFPRCYSVLPPTVPGGKNEPCPDCQVENLPA